MVPPPASTAPALPEELWREIMSYTIDDLDLLRADLPELDSMALCSWESRPSGEWWLRTPCEDYLFRHRASLNAKLVIALICRTATRVAQELAFRSVIIGDVPRLQKLCARLDQDASLGWWTKRVHISIPKCNCKQGADLPRCVHTKHVEDSAIPLLRHCPNLRILQLSDCMAQSFVLLAETLLTYHTNSLHSPAIHVPHEEQPRLITLLDHLPSLESLFLTIDTPPQKADERTIPGSGTSIMIDLPNLKTLKLHGHIVDIVEQVFAWTVPLLTSLNLDFRRCTYDFPDVSELLASNGLGHQLRTFDLNSLPPFDVAAILAACPNLTRFCFNIDWPLGGTLTLPGHPHPNIECIGLYGLNSAFGVGVVSAFREAQPFLTNIIRRQNDLSFVALNKGNFPALKSVRVISPQLLRDLNRNNGPAKGEGFTRWERWWSQCTRQGIRLEDCTGGQLGDLPCEDDEGEDEDDGEGEGDDASWEDDRISEQDVNITRRLAAVTIQ